MHSQGKKKNQELRHLETGWHLEDGPKEGLDLNCAISLCLIFGGFGWFLVGFWVVLGGFC